MTLVQPLIFPIHNYGGQSQAKPSANVGIWFSGAMRTENLSVRYVLHGTRVCFAVMSAGIFIKKPKG